MDLLEKCEGGREEVREKHQSYVIKGDELKKELTDFQTSKLVPAIKREKDLSEAMEVERDLNAHHIREYRTRRLLVITST